jgi:diguanylate cyclase (GGDEF)-like protein
VLADAEAARLLLQGFVGGQPDVHGASLIRPDGKMLLLTAAPPGKPLPNILENTDRRADFERALRATGLSLSRPHQAYLFPSLVIPVRFTVRDRSGRVRYLIQAGLPMERQQALWRDLGLMEDAALGLLRDDAYLISRIPDESGGKVYQKQLLNGAAYLATRSGRENDVYEGRVADGSYRIGVYQRLARQPVYAFLSHLRSTFVAKWWKEVWLPFSVVIGFLATCFLTYWQLTARYRARMNLIQAHLARQPGESGEDPLPTSGVLEIDTLTAALDQSRKKLHEALRNRGKLLLAAAEAGTYMVRERDGLVLSADQSLLDMLGRREAEVVGRRWRDFVEGGAEDGQDEAAELTRRVVRVGIPSRSEPRWLSVAEYRETQSDGDILRHGLAIDVTDRELLLNQVNLQTQRLQALWQVATTRYKSDSEKMRLMLQLGLDTLHMEAVLVNERQGSRLVVREMIDGLRLFHGSQEFPLEDTLCRLAIESGTSLIVPDLLADPELQNHPLVVEAGVRGFASIPVYAGSLLYGTLVFLRRRPLDENFSADDRAFMELLAAWFGQILLEEKQRGDLERIAMTDALTRLINRRAAEERLQEEIARARRTHDEFSIAVCDLDRFKLINDHYGHDVGDAVLMHVAEIMRAALREGDWVARWGGEEFIIFLHQAGATAAFTAMERLRLAIKGNPVTTEHGPLDITTSIGLGTYRGKEDLASVLSEADGCLFEAKRTGRDRVVMSESSRRGILWKAGMLQHALLDNRIVPAYQVIVDLRTCEVVADEALARIIEPDGRIVVAGEFIQAAEGINLIHLVDEAILRHSMTRCAHDLCTGRAGPQFAHFVNLSAHFLARREMVQAMLHQAAEHCRETGMTDTKVKPLVLEITERQLIENVSELMNDLQPLVEFGFRLALDDFGSGYSSFLYLASLPVSFLKIEGWMVQNMRSNAKVLGMVRSIIALAHDQGITTIAECVEDAATADLLRELGADWAQGWYFGRPQCDAAAVQALNVARTGTNDVP